MRACLQPRPPAHSDWKCRKPGPQSAGSCTLAAVGAAGAAAAAAVPVVAATGCMGRNWAPFKRKARRCAFSSTRLPAGPGCAAATTRGLCTRALQSPWRLGGGWRRRGWQRRLRGAARVPVRAVPAASAATILTQAPPLPVCSLRCRGCPASALRTEGAGFRVACCCLEPLPEEVEQRWQIMGRAQRSVCRIFCCCPRRRLKGMGTQRVPVLGRCQCSCSMSGAQQATIERMLQTEAVCGHGWSRWHRQVA